MVFNYPNTPLHRLDNKTILTIITLQIITMPKCLIYVTLLIGIIHLQSVQSAATNAISSEFKTPFSDYVKLRKTFIDNEVARGIGAGLQLNSKETRLNDHIMKLKVKEINDGIVNPSSFAPAEHFFKVVDKINKMDLFKIIAQMPKGGLLHAHDAALCNLDYFIELTYWKNLWMLTNPTTNQPEFKFSRERPGSGWYSVEEERKIVGAQKFDKNLRSTISMFTDDPIMQDRDVNSIWKVFLNTFAMVDGVLMYKEAWKAYYLQALKEFEDDGVNYLELRSTLPPLYDLDNNVYDELKVAQIYYDATQEYKKTHPKFMGAKIIYAPIRVVDNKTFLHYMETARRLYVRRIHSKIDHN